MRANIQRDKHSVKDVQLSLEWSYEMKIKVKEDIQFVCLHLFGTELLLIK